LPHVLQLTGLVRDRDVSHGPLPGFLIQAKPHQTCACQFTSMESTGSTLCRTLLAVCQCASKTEPGNQAAFAGVCGVKPEACTGMRSLWDLSSLHHGTVNEECPSSNLEGGGLLCLKPAPPHDIEPYLGRPD